MSKYCPITNTEVVYLACLECDDKRCEYQNKTDLFYCLVVGSRSFNDYELLKNKLDFVLRKYENIVIVSGGADGADALAKRYANEKSYIYMEFPANWKKYARSAGYIRNKQMHDYIAQFPHRGCIAFWDGKSVGTQYSFDMAKERNTQLLIVNTQKG